MDLFFLVLDLFLQTNFDKFLVKQLSSCKKDKIFKDIRKDSYCTVLHRRHFFCYLSNSYRIEPIYSLPSFLFSLLIYVLCKSRYLIKFTSLLACLLHHSVNPKLMHACAIEMFSPLFKSKHQIVYEKAKVLEKQPNRLALFYYY